MSINQNQKLAIAILSLNEQDDIGKCINSARRLSCPIYVIDSGSTDRTVNISRELGVQVVNFEWNFQYPKKKQWTLDYLKDKFEWVLLLDADERITDDLSEEIMYHLQFANYDAYDVNLNYWFLGKQLKFGSKARKRILLRPKKIKFPIIDDLGAKNMWEVEGHYQPIVSSNKIYKLKNNLEHEDSGALFDYFNRHNRYSDWEAHIRTDKERINQVLASRPIKARYFERLPLKSLVAFLHSYVIKLGFLDGARGFHYAIFQGFYYWQIALKLKERKRG